MDRYGRNTNNKKVSINCSCFGCLASIVGLLGILYIAFHLTPIFALVFG